jgi:Phage integrase, N-terminal/Integrase
MRALNYQLKQLGIRNRDGSYASQASRARILSLAANQLYALGYKKLHATELKGRHVNALVKEWQRQGLTSDTIKNRLAALRWWAEKVGRTWVLAHNNAHYGIPDRQYVTNVSKVRPLNSDALARVCDPHVRMSLELQRTFGLRRKEAIKFQPMYPWRSSGAKGFLDERREGARDPHPDGRAAGGARPGTLDVHFVNPTPVYFDVGKGEHWGPCHGRCRDAAW